MEWTKSKRAVIRRLPLRLVLGTMTMMPLISLSNPVMAAPNNWIGGIIGQQESTEEVKLKIEVTKLDKWVNERKDITVSVTDENNTGKLSVAKLEVKKGDEADCPYEDITEKGSFFMDENTNVYVKVTETDGKETEKKFSYNCFDLEDPTINAGIDGEYLYVSAGDGVSGVKCIYVNDVAYDELTDGMMTINLKDYQADAGTLTISAMDNAGNSSKIYRVKNPYFTDSKTLEQNSDASKNNSNGTSASDPTSATGSVTEYSVTEQESSNGYGAVKKEFYTIRTYTDKVFYLVIDKNQSQDNVYLLTEVNENDLLNFVNYSGDKIDLGDVPLYTLSESCKDEEVSEKTGSITEDLVADVNQTQNSTKNKVTSKNGSNWIVIVIAIAAVAGYYFVKKRNTGEDFEDTQEEESPEERKEE